jgi:hypothetical protein
MIQKFTKKTIIHYNLSNLVIQVKNFFNLKHVNQRNRSELFLSCLATTIDIKLITVCLDFTFLKLLGGGIIFLEIFISYHPVMGSDLFRRILFLD